MAKTADGVQATDVSCILAYDEIADLAVLSCDSKVMAEPLTLGGNYNAVGFVYFGIADCLLDNFKLFGCNGGGCGFGFGCGG